MAAWHALGDDERAAVLAVVRRVTGRRKRTPAQPRSVPPGIATQPEGQGAPEPGVYVGLDWIRCTAPEDALPSIRRLALERFGSESKATNGAKWFGRGQLWEPGIVISWDHRSRICQIDVQGSRLRLMEGDDRVALLDQIMWEGFKPTRIDGAIDYVGQGGRLWENAKASCERGELCILRSYGGNDRFTASGVVTRRHLSLGSRESPVCARIYDKGLEQSASATPGHWERLEVEWKADRAVTVAQAAARSVASSREALAARILGAIDFRVVSERSELSRRARCAWWSELLDSVSAIRVASARHEGTLDSWIQGFRTSYASTIVAFADALGVAPAMVLRPLLSGVAARRNADKLIHEYCLRFSRCKTAAPLSACDGIGASGGRQ